MRPLVFEPILKRIRWGGRRLGTVLNKAIGPGNDYAESWEVCDRGVDQSIVSSGEFQGWTLHQLLTEFPQSLLGRHRGLTHFPLLMKFLDTDDRLSLQVHPDVQPTPGGGGHITPEAWVVLSADPGSFIFAGLKAGIDRPLLEAHLAANTVEECLHSFVVSAGDCILVPAGTLHALGEGILLAEVKQAGDVTYRLHDWNRLDRDGQPRALHVAAALDCIDFNSGPLTRQQPRLLQENGSRVEELANCPSFVIERTTTRETMQFPNDGQFHILMILEGAADLDEGGTQLPLHPGGTVFLPAERNDLSILPARGLTFLDIYLP